MDRLRQLAGSVLFTFWMFFSVGFYALAILLVAPFSVSARFAITQSWIRMVLWTLRILCRIDYSVRGLENVPDGACIFLLKHSSAFETLAEIEIFGRQTWVLKRELLWVPIFGWALKLLDPIAINRGSGRSAVRQVLDQGRQALERGSNVMIFPEGTRVQHGETRRYGASGAALAAHTGRPIIPVAHNAGVFWPRRGLRKFPGTVEFVVGAPVFVGERDVREVNAEIQAWIEDQTGRMGGRELRGRQRPAGAQP